MGSHFMGDEFHLGEPLPMTVKVRGTTGIGKVSVFRGEQVVYVHEPGSQEAEFEFLDRDMNQGAGTQYYYVRVEQTDGNVAWGSPMWVNY